MHKILVVLLAGLAMVGASAPTKLGLGGSFTEALRFGGGEVFGDLGILRISVTYWAPLLPGEGPTALFSVGLRLATGEVLQPFLVGFGGAVLEASPVFGTRLGWAFGGSVGLEWWVSPRFGVYLSGSATFAWRNTPHGTALYPYFFVNFGLCLSLTHGE